jgi:hypothetical protein
LHGKLQSSKYPTVEFGVTHFHLVAISNRRILHALNLPIHIREVCVFIIPWMASNTTLAAYFLASEVKVPSDWPIAFNHLFSHKFL